MTEPNDLPPVGTALWHIQRERDQQANRVEEAEAAWTEEKQLNMTLNARVTELEAELAEAQAELTELRPLAKYANDAINDLMAERDRTVYALARIAALQAELDEARSWDWLDDRPPPETPTIRRPEGDTENLRPDRG